MFKGLGKTRVAFVFPKQQEEAETHTKDTRNFVPIR